MTIESKDDQSAIRAKARSTLESLNLECESLSDIPSWIKKETTIADSSSAESRFFHHTGFLHIPSFVDSTTCNQMKQEMGCIVDSEWDPEVLHSFSTSNDGNIARGDYFLESSNKIHFFAEPEALDEDQRLRERYQTAKLHALNKVGHALHLRESTAFHSYTHSDRVQSTVTDLGWVNAVVPQSMYILKQSFSGGVVHSHQDSTFLFTEPRQTCLGLWLALDDATLENGCLWVRPKSHREGLRRQFLRNEAYFGAKHIAERSNEPADTAITTTSTEPTKLIMKNLQNDHGITWDGSLPENGWQGLLEAGFIPIECQAGDLLAFCGETDHLSLPNTSPNPRHTFQLHLVEGPEQGVAWSELNWLQYPDGAQFRGLELHERIL